MADQQTALPGPSRRDRVRAQFEQAMQEKWNEHVQQEHQKFRFRHVTVNGKFSYYADGDTDNAWIGYQAALLFNKVKL